MGCVFKDRRSKLLKELRSNYSHIKKGAIILFSEFENERLDFKQESSFYYFTGINEPAVVFVILWDEKEILFVPNYSIKRDQWVKSDIKLNLYNREFLGEIIPGYFMKRYFLKEQYNNLINFLKDYLDHDSLIFALNNSNNNIFSSVYRLDNIIKEMNKKFINKNKNILDILRFVNKMRRKKDAYELSLISKAIDITINTHKFILSKIQENITENYIKGEIELFFTKNNSRSAFPSIVASGKNSTILHYTPGTKKLNNSDLVVIDIGAEFQNYCSDITRTYSVSKKFSSRQKDVYKIVLETQNYIASIARPGMFLSHNNYQDRSLNHLAKKFLKKLKYDQYFAHNIGHFLGLDVHDVGELSEELSVGDVFTIEPGLYIAKENIGIRIEDDFVITDNGCRCLSSGLSRDVSFAESFVIK